MALTGAEFAEKTGCGASQFSVVSVIQLFWTSRLRVLKGGTPMNSVDAVAILLTELDEARLGEMVPLLEALHEAVSRLDELDLQDVEPAVTLSVMEGER